MAEQRKDRHDEVMRMVGAETDGAYVTAGPWQASPAAHDQAFMAFLRQNMTFGCHRCDKTVTWDEVKVPAPTVDDKDTATFHLYCSDACADLGCAPEHCDNPRVAPN